MLRAGRISTLPAFCFGVVTVTDNTTFLIDEFAVLETIRDNLLKIRLFPFGRLVKNGKERFITPELAARFRLPHFKPPLKLGSHANDQPAGGRIVSLEVGDDGLYGIVEATEKGQRVIADRDYNYHSPEVIWEDGFLEHPETGEEIRGPLIVGDALLHNPHLGESAALFSIEPIISDGGDPMTDYTEMIPVSALDKLAAFFKRTESQPEPEQPEPQPADQVDYATELQARDAEVERLSSEIQAMKAEQEHGQRVSHFAAELPKEGEDVHQLLAKMNGETAEMLTARFKALYAQIEHQPDQDVGGAGSPEETGEDPVRVLNSAVEKYAAEHNVDYNKAFKAVALERPDLIQAYGGVK